MTLNSWPTVYLSSCLMYMYLAQCHPLLYPKPCCKEVAGFCSMYSSWGLILKFSSGLLWWIYVNCFKAYILLIVNNSWLVLLPFVFSQVPLLNGEIIGKCLWFCLISTVEPLHNKTRVNPYCTWQGPGNSNSSRRGWCCGRTVFSDRWTVCCSPHMG